MARITIKNKAEKARYAVVGSANTIIDFGLLFLLSGLGFPTIAANIISTTTAFCFSFFANKTYTFQTSGTNVRRELLSFVLVTLFGLWILQTIIIDILLGIIGSSLSHTTALFVAKLCATAVSLIWNYVLYSRIVFKKKEA